MSTIRERLLERKRIHGSVPKLTAEQVTAIRTWFDQNPTGKFCYIFHDGSIAGADCGLKLPGSRQEGLNSIATRGIPAIISRGHAQIEETFGIPYGIKQPLEIRISTNG